MEKARVLVVEDSGIVMKAIADVLADNGHQLVARAHSVEEANRIIDGLKPGAVNLALIDGDLPLGEDRESVSHSSERGTEVARRIREKFGQTIVRIGISGFEPLGEVKVNLHKTELTSELQGTIAALPEPPTENPT